MNRIDPINSTAADGVACSHCGEDGDFEQIDGKRIPICDACFNDLTDICPTCEQRFWNVDGVQIYRTADRYCRNCANAHPAMSAGRYRELLDDTLRGK